LAINNGGGTATSAPQTSLFLTGMQGYDLVLQVQAQCDTTLLAHWRPTRSGISTMTAPAAFSHV
jgi:hypothetical protein